MWWIQRNIITSMEGRNEAFRIHCDLLDPCRRGQGQQWHPWPDSPNRRLPGGYLDQRPFDQRAHCRRWHCRWWPIWHWWWKQRQRCGISSCTQGIKYPGNFWWNGGDAAGWSVWPYPQPRERPSWNTNHGLVARTRFLGKRQLGCNLTRTYSWNICMEKESWWEAYLS